MASVPIDLSSFKPVAGQGRQAAEIANAFTTIELYTGSALDPNALTQKGAVIGQTLVWDGSKWTPGDQRYPVAPTMIGPTITPSTAVTLTANTAYLMPLANIVVPTPITRIGFRVGASSTGNTDVGIYYSDDDATFTRLGSKGSTATPANGEASFAITQATLTPVSGRRWYLALACSSATPTFGAVPVTSTFFPNSFSKASAFPLPSSLTSVTSPSGVQLYLYGLV